METQAVQEAGTLAEALGVTEELAEAIARVAEDELEAGRADPARVILEGLVVANPRATGAWLLLARAHRALGQPLAARFCGEVAASLDPSSPEARLGRAEGLLPYPEARAEACALLDGLAKEGCEVGRRARALLAAIGGAALTNRDR